MLFFFIQMVFIIVMVIGQRGGQLCIGRMYGCGQGMGTEGMQSYSSIQGLHTKCLLCVCVYVCI